LQFINDKIITLLLSNQVNFILQWPASNHLTTLRFSRLTKRVYLCISWRMLCFKKYWHNDSVDDIVWYWKILIYFTFFMIVHWYDLIWFDTWCLINHQIN
jgi:hypothetical protein